MLRTLDTGAETKNKNKKKHDNKRGNGIRRTTRGGARIECVLMNSMKERPAYLQTSFYVTTFALPSAFQNRYLQHAAN